MITLVYRLSRCVFALSVSKEVLQKPVRMQETKEDKLGEVQCHSGTN